jgi:cyclase
MDHDGTKNGYDVEFYETISRLVKTPIVASGGAGGMEHVLEAFRRGADAALLASLLHFGEMRIGGLKKYLDENGIPVRV